MINLELKTKLNPEEVVKRAIEFFGPEGYGLEIKEQSENCVYFEGGGGGVEVTASIKDNEISVELQSREWDFQVKEFIDKIR